MPDRLYSAEELTVTYNTHDLPSGKIYLAKCLEFEQSRGIGRSEELALQSLVRNINFKREMYNLKLERKAWDKQISLQTAAYSKDWNVIGLITVPGWENSRQIAVLDDMVMTVVYGCYGDCSVCRQRQKGMMAVVKNKPASMVRSDQFVLVYDKPVDVEPLDYLNQILGLRAEFRIRY